MDFVTNPVPKAKRCEKQVRQTGQKRKLLPCFSLDAASRFMNAQLWQWHPRLVPFWSLKFFAGIRDAEAARMDWNMIDLDGRGNPPARHCLENRRSTDGENPPEPRRMASATCDRHPAVSRRAKWLDVTTTRKSSPVSRLRTRRERLPKSSCFLSNAARHSFGTYHLFHFRNAGETALQLGHKSNPGHVARALQEPDRRKTRGRILGNHARQSPEKYHEHQTGEKISVKASPSITANVVKEGELFVATSSRYPGEEGRGLSPEIALDELGKALEKHRLDVGALKAHPLCPTILDWFNSTRGSAIEFKPEAEFRDLLRSSQQHEIAKQYILQTYRESAILGAALVGGEYNQAVHEVLYKTSGHSLGSALIHAAGLAWMLPNSYPAFVKSLRLPGFVAPLEAWARCNEFLEPFDGKKELKWIHRNIVIPDHPTAFFWQDACRDSFEGDLNAFNFAMAKETVAAKKARLDTVKRRKRGVKERDTPYLHTIKGGWVPAAIWCMADSEIVATITPEKREGMSDAYKRVQRDISTLGYTRSRKRTGL